MTGNFTGLSPIFHGKNGFPVDFPLSQSIDCIMTQSPFWRSRCRPGIGQLLPEITQRCVCDPWGPKRGLGDRSQPFVGLKCQWEFEDSKMEVLYHIKPYFPTLTCGVFVFSSVSAPPPLADRAATCRIAAPCSRTWVAGWASSTVFCFFCLVIKRFNSCNARCGRRRRLRRLWLGSSCGQLEHRQ